MTLDTTQTEVPNYGTNLTKVQISEGKTLVTNTLASYDFRILLLSILNLSFTSPSASTTMNLT